jgi:hypothetical protein
MEPAASGASCKHLPLTVESIGEHPHWRIPLLDERGAPLDIDLRRVMETGITPFINTGIAGRQAGTGQVGAGVVRTPLACFVCALESFFPQTP